jgi:hypothetical protein
MVDWPQGYRIIGVDYGHVSDSSVIAQVRGGVVEYVARIDPGDIEAEMYADHAQVDINRCSLEEWKAHVDALLVGDPRDCTSA